MDYDMIIGFTCSAFDLLHAGHISMLRECKENCDYLIVGLHIDPSFERKSKNKPIQSIYERYLQLERCKYIDKIIPYQTEKDLLDIMKMENISLRFIGEEYKGKNYTGWEEFPNRTVYNKRRHNFSSSELRNRIKNEGNIL